MSISANEAIKDKKRQECESILEDFLDSPHASANHLVFGMDIEQRKQARGLEDNNSVHNWV